VVISPASSNSSLSISAVVSTVAVSTEVTLDVGITVTPNIPRKWFTWKYSTMEKTRLLLEELSLLQVDLL